MRQPLIALTLIATAIPALGADYTKPANEKTVVAEQHKLFLREIHEDTIDHFHLLAKTADREIHYAKTSDKDDSPHRHVRVAILWVFTRNPDEFDNYYFRNFYEFVCETGEAVELEGQQQLDPHSEDKQLFERILHSVCKE